MHGSIGAEGILSENLRAIPYCQVVLSYTNKQELEL